MRRSDDASSKFDAEGAEVKSGCQLGGQESVDMELSPDTLRQMDEDAADFQDGELGPGAAGLASTLLRKAVRCLLEGRQVQAVEAMGLTSLHKFDQAVLLDELWDIGETEAAEPARRTVDFGTTGNQLVHVGFGSRGSTFTPGRIELHGSVTVAEIPLAAVGKLAEVHFSNQDAPPKGNANGGSGSPGDDERKKRRRSARTPDSKR